MSGFRSFLNSGHAPTLHASFLYFAFSCCTWVLNGAMAPFISETFNLSHVEKGLGIAGAVLIAPPLAQAFGWVAVYGIAAVAISIPMVVICGRLLRVCRAVGGEAGDAAGDADSLDADVG